MRKVLTIIGGLCLVYFLCINIIFGYTTFSGFYLILGIVCIGYAKYNDKIWTYSLFEKMYKPIKIIFCIGITIFIMVEGYIVLYPKNNIEFSDYVIVLGAGVKGETLTTTLKDRLDATLTYIDKSGFKGTIVVSGGQGPGEDISEAEAMKRYLVKEGVESERIVKEDKSTSTYENFKYSKGVIESLNGNDIGEEKITAITTDFHGPRSKMLSKRNGYENVKLYTSNTRWYLVPVMYVREFFAFGKSIVFDK
ncbi:MAG: YdcF family protein [Clostridium sp.]